MSQQISRPLTGPHKRSNTPTRLRTYQFASARRIVPEPYGPLRCRQELFRAVRSCQELSGAVRNCQK
eukprot:13798039-Alexandrium_andersonii.AAC.1